MGLLVAGGVLFYVQSQSQRSSPLPEFPPDPTPNLALGSAVQRLPAPEIAPPPEANPMASEVPARACPQATATAPITIPITLDIVFPLPTPIAAPAVPDMFPAERPDPAPPLSPSSRELWTSSGFPELDRTGGDQKLTFFNKRPEEDEPLTFDGSNTSGIGSQYRVLKNADTTFLGRVASRFSQVYPGLSEEERVSEVFLGCQFEHRLNRRNKVFSAVEFARDPADLGTHRVRTQAAWEVLLDPEENLSLRTTVLESSNYVPNREQAKNVNYNLNLIWKF